MYGRDPRSENVLGLDLAVELLRYVSFYSSSCCFLCHEYFAMRPDFATCGAEFLNNSDGIYAKYVYNGSVRGILSAANTVLITDEGCKQLCGTGIEYAPNQSYAHFCLRRKLNSKIDQSKLLPMDRCRRHHNHMVTTHSRAPSTSAV